MSVTEAPASEEVATAEPPTTEPPSTPVAAGEAPLLKRYNLFERLLHWIVAITFIALMVSGLALAYPRMWWLSNLFGGGQTMRAAHPWFGVVFTAGVVVMLLIWARGMVLRKVDWQWFGRLGRYIRDGHTGVDSGRWNGGQKGYYWVSLVFGLILLITGIPLWVRSISWLGIDEWARWVSEWSRLIHNAAFLIMVGGFIIHVLLSAFMFPGTMQGMTSGKVTRAWAAWHHPRWFREQTSEPEQPGAPQETETMDAGDAEAGGDPGPETTA